MFIFRFIMKFFVVLSAFLAVGFAQYCYNDVVGGCSIQGIYYEGFRTICLVVPLSNFGHCCL